MAVLVWQSDEHIEILLVNHIAVILSILSKQEPDRLDWLFAEFVDGFLVIGEESFLQELLDTFS